MELSSIRPLFIINRFWPLFDGAQRTVADLAVELHSRGMSCTILTASSHPDWPQRISFHGIAVDRLSMMPAADNFADHLHKARLNKARGAKARRATSNYVRAITRWLHANRDLYNLVFVSSLRLEAYAAMTAFASLSRGRRPPLLLRGERPGRNGDCLWQLDVPGGRQIKRRLLEADAFIAPSPQIEEELIAAGYARDRIHYLPHSVRQGRRPVGAAAPGKNSLPLVAGVGEAGHSSDAGNTGRQGRWPVGAAAPEENPLPLVAGVGEAGHGSDAGNTGRQGRRPVGAAVPGENPLSLVAGVGEAGNCSDAGAATTRVPKSERQEKARAALASAGTSFKLHDWAPLAVFTGRLTDENCLAAAIDAWQAVAARWPNARFWIVGDGPQRSRLQSHILDRNLSGQVVLTGVFDNVSELLDAADVFISPSPLQDLSVAVLEAMAAGLPVVAVDNSSNRELIGHGRCGLLFSQPIGDKTPAARGDADDECRCLSDAVGELFGDPHLARRMGQAGHELIAERFDFAHSVESYITLFEEMLSGSRNY